MSERVVSQPPEQSRLSVQPASKATAKKTALQPSESNTDTESMADPPASALTTRRKAKNIQSRLGKGRPVIAGGSGARNITKVISRGTGRRGNASAMLQEDPIPEGGTLLPMRCLAVISNHNWQADENTGATNVPTDLHAINANIQQGIFIIHLPNKSWNLSDVTPLLSALFL
jgi:hypothetical protein